MVTKIIIKDQVMPSDKFGTSVGPSLLFVHNHRDSMILARFSWLFRGTRAGKEEHVLMWLNTYANEESWVYFQRLNEHAGKFYSGLNVQNQVGWIFSFTVSFVLH